MNNNDHTRKVLEAIPTGLSFGRRNYYLYDKPTDLRKSFNTLGYLVREEMGLDLTSGSGFIFINRRRTHLKMLVWEGDGLSIYYKRLEESVFVPPSLPGYLISLPELGRLLSNTKDTRIWQKYG